MIEAIAGRIRDRWADLRPGQPPPTDASVVVGVSKVPDGKVSIILFDAEQQPSVVAKISRTAVGESALSRENAVLEHFWDMGCSFVTDYAPKPLLLEKLDGRAFLALTYRPGHPMLTRYQTPGHTGNADRVAEDFAAAGEWLEGFHRQTLSGAEQLDAEGFERRVTAVFDRYRDEVGWSDEEEELAVAVAHRAADLRGCPVPVTGVHGDFWMGNLLMEDTRIAGVLDWEIGITDGIPLTDIYKFPTSYGFYLDRAHPGSQDLPGHPDRMNHLYRWLQFGRWPNLVGFGYTYFGRGWFPDLARRFILGHLAALGIPAAMNGIFFPVFLAEQAMTLDVPAFRQGYRSLLRALASERKTSWLWAEDAHAELGGIRVR
jgi:aminoglycoside phosphotransferase (APT) family kinase protein